MDKLKVFVIYSWEGDIHQQMVLSFVNKLRKDGIEAEIDRIKTQSETALDFNEMMHRAIVQSDKIIIVLSEGYKKKAENFTRGVGFEYGLLIKDFKNNPKKYIIVSFESLKEEITPLFLSGRDAIDMNKPDSFNFLYSKLLDEPIIKISEVSKNFPTVIKEDIPDFDTLFKKKLIKRDEIHPSNREIQIMESLKQAATEPNLERAKNEYRKIIANLKSLEEDEYYVPSLKLQAQIEYTRLISNPNIREDHWEKLLKKMVSSLNKYPENEDLIENSIDSIVAYMQDGYIDKDFVLIKRGLKIISGKLNSSINKKPIDKCHNLLVKKATVLRNTSSFESTPLLIKRRAQQAVDCIEKALTLNRSWYGYLELGNSLWNLSKYSTNEIKYNSLIERAEKAYWESCNLQLNSRNSFTLCLFYRKTYQPSPFISAFKQYEEIEDNRIRFLDNSNLLAETAISVFYSGYPEEPLKEIIAKSIQMLESAIDYGIADARKIVNLAFLKACNGEISVSQEILKTLELEGSFSWNELIKNLEKFQKSEDLFSKGFILGIDNPAIWNRLGTYALDFLENFHLSNKLYDVSLLHNPTNPITLTNKARLLTLEYPENDDKLKEAEKLISKAASQSNFRFQWWREVRNEIEALLGKSKGNVIPMTKRGDIKLKLRDKNALIKSLNQLEGLQDLSLKKENFEKILNTLISRSISNKYNSFVYENKHQFNEENIFYFDKDLYRFQFVWNSHLVKLEEIISFWSNLKDTALNGLLISGNDFDSSVIKFLNDEKNKSNIILMNRKEVEMALFGKISFDEMIRIKQIFLKYENNHYYNMKTTANKVQIGNMA